MQVIVFVKYIKNNNFNCNFQYKHVKYSLFFIKLISSFPYPKNDVVT